jgi:ArsR family transcriptional regulator
MLDTHGGIVYNPFGYAFKYTNIHETEGGLNMEPSLGREIHLLHAQICQALADPKRIALLYILDQGPQCVSDLAEALRVPQPSVSYHLKVLRERGLASAEQEGTTVYYSLTDRRIIEALDLLRSMLADILAQQASLMVGTGPHT